MPEYVKALNRRLILDLTRRWQPVSRARLSDLSGLNKSTVTSIVRDLLDEGLVQEAGTDPSTGGRPGIQLVLNPRRFQVVAVEIGVTTSHLLVTDINGAAWLRDSMPTPAAPADMIAAVRAFVRRAAAAGVCRPSSSAYPGWWTAKPARSSWLPTWAGGRCP